MKYVKTQFRSWKPAPEPVVVVEHSTAQIPKSQESSLEPNTLSPRPRLAAGAEELEMEMETRSYQNGSINQNGSITTARDENVHGDNSGQSTQLR
jgi:hypothetical protein